MTEPYEVASAVSIFFLSGRPMPLVIGLNRLNFNGQLSRTKKGIFAVGVKGIY
jgi:hypothetical protein